MHVLCGKDQHRDHRALTSGDDQVREVDLHPERTKCAPCALTACRFDGASARGAPSRLGHSPLAFTSSPGNSSTRYRDASIGEYRSSISPTNGLDRGVRLGQWGQFSHACHIGRDLCDELVAPGKVRLTSDELGDRDDQLLAVEIAVEVEEECL